MNIVLTPMQDRLIANILAMPEGAARTDVLARRTGSTNQLVPNALLPLREHGIVGSCNDGGAYNYWFVTMTGRSFLAQRTDRLRKEEAARREEAAKAEALRKQEATKQRLLQAQQQRQARHSTDPVAIALSKAMQDKGREPLANPKYIVWSPDSSLPPKVQYASHAEAVDVAGIMAQRFPKQVFIVCELQTMAYYKPPVSTLGALVRGNI
jgi:hypothetical protein